MNNPHLEKARAFFREKVAERNGPPPDKQTFDLDAESLGSRFMRPVSWLVPDFFPLGGLVVIAADGGIGKSVLSLDIAARLSVGECCLGLSYDPLPPAKTLLVQCEDSEDCTVLPRFIAAGGDPDMMLSMTTPSFTLSQTPALDRLLARHPDVRLLIIDPVSAYVPSGTNDHVDADVRTLLRPLDELAEVHNLLVLLVKHLNKSDSANAGNLVSASRAYVNASRASFLMGDDPADEARQVFVFVKKNLTPRSRGLAFARAPLVCEDFLRVLSAPQARLLDEPAKQALREQLFKIQWLGETDVTARDLARARRNSGEKDDRSARVVEAADWLRDFLASGARTSDEVFSAGESKGFTKKNLYAAKDELGFKAKPDGLRGKWIWKLPDDNPFTIEE